MTDNKEIKDVFTELPDGDIWLSEYHAPDVKFALRSEIIACEQSPFQKMVMAENETFGRFFTLNGYVQVTAKDEFVYHDMIVHPAMAVNPTIKRVLIIGGGDGGTAREVCRYPQVEKIDMVEIDEMVVRLCKEYLSQTACSLDDPKVNLIIGDGLAHVMNAADGSYDLILVDSTDPVGPGEGLFTREFYRNCLRVLSEDGIMINQQEGAFYDWDFREMARAHGKIRDVFPIARIYGFNIPSYASGYWYFGFASKNLDPLADQKAEEWEKFDLRTRYYNSDIHKAAFCLPSYVKEKLGLL